MSSIVSRIVHEVARTLSESNRKKQNDTCRKHQHRGNHPLRKNSGITRIQRSCCYCSNSFSCHIYLLEKWITVCNKPESQAGIVGSQRAVDSIYYLPRIVCIGNIKAGLLTYGSEQKHLPKNKHCVYFQWLMFLFFPITVTRIVPESHGIPCF